MTDSEFFPCGRRRLLWICLGLYCAFFLGTGMSFAQRYRNSMGGEGWVPNGDSIKITRELGGHSADTPVWTNALGFEKDLFTFARVRYTRLTRRQNGVWWNGGYWYSDSPDSDLNLSYRIQQMTSLKADPNGRVIDLTDKELADYPWIYIVEPGLMVLEDDEVVALRKYLLNGGFLMVDDFWGTPQWENFAREIKRVFPEREFTDLPLDHPIFHSVFSLEGPKEKLQVPNILIGKRSQYTGVTWEFHEGEECRELHIRGMTDDKGRLMIVACHNTDYGDGWERETEDDYFFHRFAENISFPMGINIIFYAMTH
jgi:hypothetical protein